MALLAVGALQSCDKDILVGQPEWLGNSIYERLQEGIDGDSFNYTLRLIDDLGQKEVLSQTGSKTLFVASDEDYDKWFASNSMGVHSYDELSIAQKKQLFNGTMINNAYLIELMSNTEATVTNGDPEKGMCMRRETASSIYDYVPTMTPDQFPRNSELDTDPVNKAWQEVRDAGKPIYLLEDNSSTPMIHFLPAYMQKNNIKDEDLQIISNGESDNINDSWISGKKVISKEQTCKNGYIYVVSGVMESNPNMAAIIRDETKEVKTTQWAKFLSRFSVPEKVQMSEDEKLVFARQHPELVDKELYTLRYLNSSSNHKYDSPTGKSTDALSITLLKLDPGWNQYTAAELTMKNDAGVMIVPNDDAVNAWLTSGVGKTLIEKYGSIDKVDLETMAKLLNVNILGSFASSVPSKFSSIQNDAQQPLGITKEDVVRCYMGCNGVVYVVNKMFQPAEFSSVTFPALLYSGYPNPEDPNELSFQIIYKAMQGRVAGGTNSNYDYDFTPYLTSMDSRFSTVIPYSNIVSKGNTSDVKGKRVVRFIDPCSFGMENPWLIECYVDSAGERDRRVPGAVVGKAYKITNASTAAFKNNGVIQIQVSGAQDVASSTIANRMFDYIDNAIVVGDINTSQKYYKTKAGSTIYFSDGNVRGGLQVEKNYDIKIDNSYAEANGTTYGILKDPNIDNSELKSRIPQTASKSLYAILKEEVDKGGDNLFYKMIYEPSSSFTSSLFSAVNSKYVALQNDYNLRIFDNYNYTVYVPKDTEIQPWIDNQWIPTWQDYDNLSTDYTLIDGTPLSGAKLIEMKDSVANIINSFIRYHIQDNSVYVGGEPRNNVSYETGTLNKINNRFFTVSVTTDGSSGEVKGLGNDAAIPFASEFYNKPGREIWIELPSDASSLTVNNVLSSKIAASSYIVVHKINGTLCYDKNLQQQNWIDRLGLKKKTP
jgi:hypothetical protein